MVPTLSSLAQPTQWAGYPAVQVVVSGSPGTLGAKLFIPMKTSVLDQIAAAVYHHKEATGLKPVSLVISAKEHEALKLEIGAKGAVASVEGVTIFIGDVSALPQAPPSVPDIKDKAGKNPFTMGFTGFHPAGEGEVVTGVLIQTDQPQIEVGSIGWEPTPIFSGLPTKQDVLFGLKKPKVYHSSKSDEHGTPQALFDRLNQEFQFDLDVCATAAHEVDTLTPISMKVVQQLDPGNAKCPIYFTQEENGLAQDWFGTVWMNPPYTKGQVGVWIAKLIKEMLAGRIQRAVALVAARPDTHWFHAAVSHAYDVRFLKGRLTFEGSTDPAPFPSAVFVFDPTKIVQTVRFWDWKSLKSVAYYKSPGAAALGGTLKQAGVFPWEKAIAAAKPSLLSPGTHVKLGPIEVPKGS